MLTIISQLSADHRGIVSVPVDIADGPPVPVDVNLHAAFIVCRPIGQTDRNGVLADGTHHTSVPGVVSTKTVDLTPGQSAMAKVTPTEVVLCTTALDVVHPYTHVPRNWRERERERERADAVNRVLRKNHLYVNIPLHFLFQYILPRVIYAYQYGTFLHTIATTVLLQKIQHKNNNIA